MINDIPRDTNNSLDFEYSQQDSRLPLSRLKLDESERQSIVVANHVSVNLKADLLETDGELHSGQENIPIANHQNTPIGILGQCGQGHHSDQGARPRRYNKSQDIQTLAVTKYKQNGRGITFNDLLSKGLTLHKGQAQTILKHCLRKDVLFTIHKNRPRQYYPTCLKSEIMGKNIPIEVTGVGYSKAGLLKSKPTASSLQNLDPVIVQTLEGYILPFLSKAPLHIHRMQLKVKVPFQYYHEIALPVDASNKGKQHEEIIGRAHVRYCFYANGTVMVFTESSNTPFKLKDEVDLSRLIAFFGQVRDRLVLFLADRHERIIPDIMQWQPTQWEVNKDVKVDDVWAQITGLNIQVKHIDHLFRVYIKSLGKDTVCRVEESCNSVSKPAVDTINNIFNPHEKFEKQFLEYSRKLTEIHNWVKELVNRTNNDEMKGI